MGKFERNDISLMRQEIRKNVQHPLIGRVVEVYEHGASDDDSNFEADVVIDGRKESRCPILSSGTGAIDIPEVNDKVIVLYTAGDNKKPHVVDTVWTNKTRPPIGKAGMVRRRLNLDGATSPSMAGSGDIYMTGYTKYDEPAATTEPSDRNPESSIVQIAKHNEEDNDTPTEQPSLPVKIEYYDSPKDGEAHITVTLNQDNGGASDVSWGMKFDIANGTWQIVDPEGFGIEATGDGNFTWHHKDITFNEVSGTTGPLSL